MCIEALACSRLLCRPPWHLPWHVGRRHQGLHVLHVLQRLHL